MVDNSVGILRPQGRKYSNMLSAVIPTEGSQSDVRTSTVTPEGEVWLGDVVCPIFDSSLQDFILTIW